MTSKKKRTYDKKQKMNAIRSATVELLPKRGYMNLTTKEIAEEAGVAIGLLYKYFPAGKVEIIKSIAEEMANTSVDEVMSIDEYFDAVTDVDVKKIIRQGVLRTVLVHRERRDMIIAIEMAYLSNPDAFGFYALDNYANYDNRASQLFIEFVAEQLGRKIDDSFAKFMLDIIDGIVHRHVILIPSAPSDEEFADSLTDVILNLVSCREVVESES